MANLLIRQFDVYENPERRTRDQVPFVLALQSSRFDDTQGVIVAPLVRTDPARPHSGLYPVVLVEGTHLAIVVANSPRSREACCEGQLGTCFTTATGSSQPSTFCSLESSPWPTS